MSADNTVVVLKTTRKWKKTGDNGITYREGPTPVYRVAHVLAWDNFDYYKRNSPMLVGSYLDQIFGDSEVYYTLGEALEEAHALVEKIGYVEYGVIVVDFSEFSFYNDS